MAAVAECEAELITSRIGAALAARKATVFAQTLRSQAAMLEAIANTLNESGFTTRTGAQWTAMQGGGF